MDWQLAIEKNREALKRILATLVAMAGLSDFGVGAGISSVKTTTLPRHLHRLVLRLLRPAESAARRLIIVAARGLVVEISPSRPRKPKPRSIFVRNGVGTGIVRRGSLPDRTLAASRPVSLPLFDPLKRFGVRRRYVRPSAAPRITFFGSFDRPRQPNPAPPSPEDPLDAGRLSRRLEALASALDDLPRQAKRLARWQARCDLQGRSDAAAGGQDLNHSRIMRLSPMRLGRPPGWRRRADHPVYEVLNELHGLAVWARERRDTS